MAQPQSPPADMSLRAIFAFASVSIPIQALVLAISVHLPRYFASHIGLELALVGAAFAMVRLIDIPIDVMLGMAMDRTRSRFGRYRVWLTLGAPMLMAGLYGLLLANSSTPRRPSKAWSWSSSSAPSSS